jgi:hypothetical protein
MPRRASWRAHFGFPLAVWSGKKVHHHCGEREMGAGNSVSKPEDTTAQHLENRRTGQFPPLRFGKSDSDLPNLTLVLAVLTLVLLNLTLVLVDLSLVWSKLTLLSVVLSLVPPVLTLVLVALSLVLSALTLVLPDLSLVLVILTLVLANLSLV